MVSLTQSRGEKRNQESFWEDLVGDTGAVILGLHPRIEKGPGKPMKDWKEE
jgi:hypothetical protein